MILMAVLTLAAASTAGTLGWRAGRRAGWNHGLKAGWSIGWDSAVLTAREKVES